MPHRATEKAPVLVGRPKGVRGKCGQEPLLGSCRKANSGRVNSLGLAGQNGVGGLGSRDGL